MLSKKNKMLIDSLDSVNQDYAKLKNKNAALESIVKRQEQQIKHLEKQLDSLETDSVLRTKNREQGKKINALNFTILQYKQKLKLVHDKTRHAFEMSRDDIEA